MLFLLVACSGPSKDDTGPPVAEALPTAIATMDPSCGETDGSAWAVTIGVPSAACEGVTRSDLDSAIWVNQDGPQTGPGPSGGTFPIGRGASATAAWTRNGEEGDPGGGTLVIDAWDAAEGTFTGSLTLAGAFDEGPVLTEGTFSGIYCPNPDMICG